MNELEKRIIELYKSGLSQVNTGKEVGLSDYKVRKVLKKHNIHIRTNREQALKYHCNENYFEKINTPDKAYWLGIMFSDGFISKGRKDTSNKVGLSLNYKDYETVDNFRRAISSNHKIKTYVSTSGYSSKSKYNRIIIYSNKMVKDLISLGITYNKNNSISIDKVDKLPNKLKYHFIRGFMDGDGSISKSSDGYTIRFSGNTEIIKWLKKTLGVNTIISHRYPDRDNNNSNYQIGGNIQVLKILGLIYENSNDSNRMRRKYNRYIKLKERYKQ